MKNKRFIDADACAKLFEKRARPAMYDGTLRWVVPISEIDNVPAADAAELVHGRWEQVKRWSTKAKYRCSVCGREIMSAVKVNIEKYPYCHCGANMDGGSSDE